MCFTALDAVPSSNCKIHLEQDHLYVVVDQVERHTCLSYSNMAVSIRWTGLGTGLWDWTVGLDSQKVALILSSD